MTQSWMLSTVGRERRKGGRERGREGRRGGSAFHGLWHMQTENGISRVAEMEKEEEKRPRNSLLQKLYM